MGGLATGDPNEVAGQVQVVTMRQTEAVAQESEAVTLEAQALAAHRRRDYGRALALYKKLIALGSYVACYEAANIILNGWGGVRPDPVQAVEWFEQASASSNPDLQGLVAARLYDVYYGGVPGVPKDYKRAVRYVKKYEYVEYPTLVDAPPMYRLGVAYEFGYGMAKNVEKAMELYRRAAATRHIPSKINLARRRFLRGNFLAIVPWLAAAFHGQYLVLVARSRKRPLDIRLM